MKKRLVILIIAAIIVLAIALRYTFFYTEKCETAECFFQKLGTCSKANFLNDKDEATWRYQITSDKGSTCEIQVTLLQQKSSDLELSTLESKSMTCSLPVGIVEYPEKNLEYCHGELKEEIQAIMIKKLHTYIIDNIGQINDELNAF